MLGIFYYSDMQRRDEGVRPLKKALELNPSMSDGATLKDIVERYEGR